MSKTIPVPLTVALGATLLSAGAIAHAASSSVVFQITPLSVGYAPAADEGKCGEGKCGVPMMDTNKDGKVSMQEANAVGFSEKQFKAWDKNGDGVLDKSELDAMHSVKGKEGYCSTEPAKK